ncbi:diguanylate cyclase [Marinobacterium sediminicola]|uniref:Diguanylate cyclase (GGDEF) domain-containing protein n=1 Tax=Marinobacterium sediminicola TaxID=518898 RepID=A0ABY1RX70_9GAMM|nr:diguanylate cyclase [Marinobacterium sediminicola]ULG67823.1 sensor domain-containing diguanylate cyclase [Marinobacterium sediminicola]SMR71499.1 diguanylate cyclase (GGDEF) domain-containing protein [Marinobacterium sediminicola]
MKRTFLRSGLGPEGIYLIVALLLVVGVVLTEYVVGMAKQRAAQIRSMEATALLASMRAQLETEVNSVLYLSRGLLSFVSAYPESTSDRWYELSKEIVREAPLVRNIGLAPDNVMRFVYPLKGNEAAIGLDYRQNKNQWPAVEEAIISGRMKMAGPLKLVQGGLGVIAREPIYFRRDGEKHYWGLASIVIDYDALMLKAGIAESTSGFDISIRGRDGTGETGEVFFGDQAVFVNPVAKMNMVFPGGNWVIAATPVNGASASVVWMRLTAWLLLAALSGVIILIYRLYRLAYWQSLTDTLTGEANRRCLMNRTEHLAQLYPRTGIGFALLFIDLNHFKSVNDTFGHQIGDLLLIAAAKRLRENCRASDTLARNGGDEFILLQPGVGREDVHKLAAKIEELMVVPFEIDGQVLNISASVGYAVFPEDSSECEAVISLADSRMYTRKRNKKALERAEKEANEPLVRV